jgi:CHAT domain-containing protein
MLPSASVLPPLDQTRIKGKIAIFADPVFDITEARSRLKELKNEKRRATPPRVINEQQEPSKRAAQDLGIEGKSKPFPRLPATRREADLLCKIFGRNCGPVYRDFDASKSNAVELPPLYAYVHFGTHGVLNNANPYKSGLVLSFYKKDLTPVYGVLRLQDIYSLKLNAELVSLSACDTASGQGTRTEGINSLVRGFLYSGAHNVLGTLWKIDSPSTPELMKLFYEGINKNGLTSAEALRRAQEAFLTKDFQLSNKSKKPQRWSHPYYWAAFTLFGASR